jgi:hypothetical protein
MEMATSETAKGDGDTSLFLDIPLRAAIQDVAYEAINMQAIIAYQKASWRSSTYQHALGCIVDKCSLDLSKSIYANTNQSGSSANLSDRSYLGMFAIFVGAAALATFVLVRQRKRAGIKEELLTKEGRLLRSTAPMRSANKPRI